MSTSKPDISHIRKEIDRVDTALLELIAQRLELAAEVRRSKSGVGVWRPSREESHVRDLASRAGDTSPALVSRIMAELISASLNIQGPMTLHIALEGDALSTWSMVRDRFGASIPSMSYPTTSAALTAAANTAEAVAVLPAPGGMSRWWTSLARGGAMDGLYILAALPRVDDKDWPSAVAVASAELAPSGADRSLVTVMGADDATHFMAGFPEAILRAQAGEYQLFSLPDYIDNDAPDFQAILAKTPSAKIIGVLPNTLSLTA